MEQLANATKSDDPVAVAAIVKALEVNLRLCAKIKSTAEPQQLCGAAFLRISGQDHTPAVRERATRSLVRMTDKDDTNIIEKVSLIFESYLKAIRDCALAVILDVASAERAVEVVGTLLAHERTDLRLWAAEALGDLASRKQKLPQPITPILELDKVTTLSTDLADQPWPPITEEEQAKRAGGEAMVSPVSALIEEGSILMKLLPDEHGKELLKDFVRSDSPLAHAVRVRTPELHREYQDLPAHLTDQLQDQQRKLRQARK